MSKKWIAAGIVLAVGLAIAWAYFSMRAQAQAAASLPGGVATGDAARRVGQTAEEIQAALKRAS